MATADWKIRLRVSAARWIYGVGGALFVAMGGWMVVGTLTGTDRTSTGILGGFIFLAGIRLMISGINRRSEEIVKLQAELAAKQADRELARLARETGIKPPKALTEKQRIASIKRDLRG